MKNQRLEERRKKIPKETRDMFQDQPICTECGQEVPKGIWNWIEHTKTCLRNAPNENIDSHNWKEQQEQFQLNEEKRFKPIFNKMSREEQMSLVKLQLCGMWQGNTILMSSDNIFKIDAFKKKMTDKYTS